MPGEIKQARHFVDGALETGMPPWCFEVPQTLAKGVFGEGIRGKAGIGSVHEEWSLLAVLKKFVTKTLSFVTEQLLAFHDLGPREEVDVGASAKAVVVMIFCADGGLAC